MMNLGTLYKKSSQGKIEQWTVGVDVTLEGYGCIQTAYGEVGGKIQVTKDIVKEGKSKGKKNETTAHQQACLEAQAKWEKKLKTGYVKSLELAESGATDEIIAGGIEPMLAHPYDKHGAKVVFPCLAQPKLDGIRCVAMKNNGLVTLWTRTRKRITSCPHIEEAVAALPFDNMTLDGELYNHEYKHDFEKIVSAVRKDEPTEEAKKVQYHVYDVIMHDHFLNRTKWIKETLQANDVVHLVETVACNSDEQVPKIFGYYEKKGYEGAMLRNARGEYETKRSYNLQKVKAFEDAEFVIVGANEGRGKLMGHLVTFTCKNSEGATFEATMAVPQEKKLEMWGMKDTFIGKMLTVQYQGLTNKEKVPRFPIGLRIREEMI